MSLPKEPRQLMINLMYLVLTAMLALNVSAEIINAFFALNKSIKNSTSIVETSNGNIKAAIDKQADAYKNATNQGWQSSAGKAQQITKEFESYVNSITEALVKEAGGVDTSHYKDGRPTRFKDKDVPTRMFLTNGKGAELEKKVREVRQQYLTLIADPKDRVEMEKQIALDIDAIPADSKAKNWSELKFKQMPVAAVMPSLTKFIGDAKVSETALLNYFFKKIGGDKIVFDGFKVAIAPKKAYLVRGDKFEADIYLAAFSTTPGANISINANGSGLALKDGVAHYETTPSGLGEQTVKASATIVNPLTKESKTVTGEFKYEVGEKSVAVSAEKMNVFYIGVTNPIAVSAAGVNSNTLKVLGTNCNINKKDNTNYDVTVSGGVEAIITVTGEGGLNAQKKFRIKKVPDPVVKFANKKGGGVGSGEAAAQRGLIPELENFDFPATCSIQSFQLTYVAKRQDAITSDNQGGVFNDKTQRLVSSAKPGDIYNFYAIRGRCPGDAIARDLGTMSIFIK
jgi:gliding motility-associated protein GldM